MKEKALRAGAAGSRRFAILRIVLNETVNHCSATCRPPLPFTKGGMESVLLAAAMLAASTNAAPGNDPVAGGALDQRCFRLMADLAEDGTPGSRASAGWPRSISLAGIDAADPGFDPDAALDAPRPRGRNGSDCSGNAATPCRPAGGTSARSAGSWPRRPAPDRLGPAERSRL